MVPIIYAKINDLPTYFTDSTFLVLMLQKSLRALSYSKEDLRIAVERVRNGEISNFAAATIYGIPKSTLNDRVLKKTGLSSETLRRPPAIPVPMEERLADCLRVLENRARVYPGKTLYK